MGGPFHAKKDQGSWSIPKGEYQPDEDPLETARREFQEELNLSPPDGELIELGTIEQSNNKAVIAWAVEGDMDVSQTTSNTFTIEWPLRSGQIQEFPEIDRAAWFTLAEAAAKLIPAQTEFLARLANKLNVPFGPESIPESPRQNSLF
jgi:predicted NUDIX family NTP pyrophosphohydrolase